MMLHTIGMEFAQSVGLGAFVIWVLCCIGVALIPEEDR